MKTFYQWAGDKELELPVLTEKTTRAGIAHWAYPDSYIRSHYPDGWFMPTAADAVQKFGNHHPHHVKHAALNQAAN